MSKHKGEWVKVGHFGVDAGLVWIGDPCYILHKEKGEEPSDIGKNWGEFCDRIYDGESGPTLKQFNYNRGHPGLGVCVSTGFGDGVYDVMAKVVDVPGWGKRVKELKIVFFDGDDLKEEPDDDDEDEDDDEDS